MIIVNNPFGQDPADFNEDTSAERVGARIKTIRIARGLSQGQLGKMVGLPADRIQKYENGIRKPKTELLKQIANALNVETLALTDPVVSNYLGAMYAFFEMEREYKLKVTRSDARLMLSFGDGMTGTMNEYLKEWEKERRYIDIEIDSAASEDQRNALLAEYNQWKWTFPKALAARTADAMKEARKALIQEKIEELKQELADLE